MNDGALPATAATGTAAPSPILAPVESARTAQEQSVLLRRHLHALPRPTRWHREVTMSEKTEGAAIMAEEGLAATCEGIVRDYLAHRDMRSARPTLVLRRRGRADSGHGRRQDGADSRHLHPRYATRWSPSSLRESARRSCATSSVSGSGQRARSDLGRQTTKTACGREGTTARMQF